MERSYTLRPYIMFFLHGHGSFLLFSFLPTAQDRRPEYPGFPSGSTRETFGISFKPHLLHLPFQEFFIPSRPLAPGQVFLTLRGFCCFARLCSPFPTFTFLDSSTRPFLTRFPPPGWNHSRLMFPFFEAFLTTQ